MGQQLTTLGDSNGQQSVQSEEALQRKAAIIAQYGTIVSSEDSDEGSDGEEGKSSQDAGDECEYSLLLWLRFFVNFKRFGWTKNIFICSFVVHVSVMQRNVNALVVQQRMRDQREEAKQQHEQKRQKDKEEMAKQKAKSNDRKDAEKKRTQKGERRR